MDKGLELLVIRGLARHRSRDEVIRAVCEQGDLKWLDAEQLVDQVEREHGQAIARGESRLLLFLSLGFVVFGAAIFYVLNTSMEYFQTLILGELFGRHTVAYRIAGSVTSVAIVAWGLFGLWSRLHRPSGTKPEER